MAIDRWFRLVWPAALLAHLGGNAHHLSALVHGRPSTVATGQLVMAGLAVAVLAGGGRRIVAGLAAGQLLVTVDKAPVIGNHEVILALMSLVVLIGLGLDRRRPVDEPGSPATTWTDRIGPALRWLFLVSYSSIALSKLNSGFLDLDASCAVLFGDEMGRWLGVTVSGRAVPSTVAAYGTTAIELLVPVLLLWPRSRWYGVVLGLTFHGILALDPTSHVIDFTSTLVPLFLLFAPETLRLRLSRSIGHLLSVAGPSVVGWLAVFGALHLVVLRSGLPAWLVPYPLWLGSMVVLGRWLIGNRPGAGGGPPPAAPVGRPRPVLLVVVALALLNGLAPYLELKTANAFNMYSNLHTARGESNHLLLPRTLPLRDLELVTVVDAEADHPLAFYVGTDLALPRENVERLLGSDLAPAGTVVDRGSEADDAQVLEGLTLADTVDGSPLTAVTTAAGPSTSERLGDWLRHKFALRRSVVTSRPRTCLRTWGPAW